MKETSARSIASTDVASLDADGTYYWRARAHRRRRGLSEAAAIQPTAHSLHTAGGPARAALTAAHPSLCGRPPNKAPTMYWRYRKAEISSHNPPRRNAVGRVHRAADDAQQRYNLLRPREGYAQRRPRRCRPRLCSSTADRSDYEAPAFVTPSADGATLHSTRASRLHQWEGLSTVTVQVSKTRGRSRRARARHPFRSTTSPLPHAPWAR